MRHLQDHQGLMLERRRAALSFLSVCGAAAAALGLGALIPDLVRPVAGAVLALGLIVHLYAMVASRRLLAGDGYRPSRLEDLGYWICWVLIAAITIVLLVEMAR